MKSSECVDCRAQRKVRKEMWKAAEGQHSLKRAMLTEDCEEVGLEWCRRGSEYTLTASGTGTSIVTNSLQTAWEVAQLFRLGIEAGRQAMMETGPFAATPLHLAAAAGNTDQVRRLLEAGNDPNARDSVIGMTPLHAAGGYGGCTHVVQLLLAAGADPNTRDRSMGGTPLHVAAHWGNAGVARLLVDVGADLRVRTLGGGETPAEVAASRGHNDLVAMLNRRLSEESS